jgi:hypothetical protein
MTRALLLAALLCGCASSGGALRIAGDVVRSLCELGGCPCGARTAARPPNAVYLDTRTGAVYRAAP